MIFAAQCVLAILGAFYAWFVLRVYHGLSRILVRAPAAKSLPFVSVIVAARNEESCIRQCIASILNQKYPGSKFELIVVDDNSADSTPVIIKSIAKKVKKVRFYSLGSTDHTSGGKPDAIALGVEKAKGQFIATTDADCQPSPSWLLTTMSQFDDGKTFQAGPVIEKTGASLLGRLESIEFTSLIVSGAGLIGAGRPIICNGANLAYRKKDFQAVNTFEKGKSSCDDETLMQRIFNRRIGSIGFTAHPSAIVETKSNNDFSSFWRQRARWASKKARYEDSSILLELALIYFFCFALLFTFIFALFIPELRLPALGAWMTKILLDWITMMRGIRLLDLRISMTDFLIAELLHLPYIVVAGALGQFVPQDWKGRLLAQ